MNDIACREDYIELCREKNLALFGKKKVLIAYKEKGRKKGRKSGCNIQRVGVVVCYREGDKLKIGASKCKKGDRFDRHIGIRMALERARAMPLKSKRAPGATVLKEIPLSMKEKVFELVEKARRYFSKKKGVA